MKRTLPFLLALLLAVAPAFAQEPPKREFRGAWLHIVGNQQIKNLSREQIQQWFTATLDALQAQGCNAVIFQVRPQADAFGLVGCGRGCGRGRRRGSLDYGGDAVSAHILSRLQAHVAEPRRDIRRRLLLFMAQLRMP